MRFYSNSTSKILNGSIQGEKIVCSFLFLLIYYACFTHEIGEFHKQLTKMYIYHIINLVLFSVFACFKLFGYNHILKFEVHSLGCSHKLCSFKLSWIPEFALLTLESWTLSMSELSSGKERALSSLVPGMATYCTTTQDSHHLEY